MNRPNSWERSCMPISEAQSQNTEHVHLTGAVYANIGNVHSWENHPASQVRSPNHKPERPRAAPILHCRAQSSGINYATEHISSQVDSLGYIIGLGRSRTDCSSSQRRFRNHQGRILGFRQPIIPSYQYGDNTQGVPPVWRSILPFRPSRERTGTVSERNASQLRREPPGYGNPHARISR